MKLSTSLAASLLLAATAVPAYADEWESLGTGRMTDFIFTAFSFAPTTFDVEIEKSTTEEGVYRIAKPYANYVNPDPSYLKYNAAYATPMVIRMVSDTKFYFEMFNTGYTAQGEEVWGISDAEYYKENFNDAVLEVMPGVYGDFDGETFTFSPTFIYNGEEAYCLLMGWGGYEYPCNIDGEFCITLPGAKDYTCAISLASPCSADNHFSVDLTYTADPTEVRYALLPGVYRITDPIFDSTIAAAEPTTLHHLDLDLSGHDDGMYTILLATLDAEGQIRRREAAYLDVYHSDAQAWRSVGTCSYTDDILASAYPQLPSATYDVTVEESVATPGLYRIVDPYGTAYPYADINLLSCGDHSHHIVIDATDPERVFILPTPLGFEVAYGPMHISSQAWEALEAGTSKSDIDAMNVWGTLHSDDRSITFPAKALKTAEFADKGKWFPSNSNGAFRLALPGSTAITGITADGSEDDAPAVYYDLYGRRVANPTPGQLLIRRQGTRTDKVIY